MKMNECSEVRKKLKFSQKSIFFISKLRSICTKFVYNEVQVELKKKLLPLKNHPPLKKFETPIGKFYQSKCHEVIQHWRLIVFCTHFSKQDRLFKWPPYLTPTGLWVRPQGVTMWSFFSHFQAESFFEKKPKGNIILIK